MINFLSFSDLTTFIKKYGGFITRDSLYDYAIFNKTDIDKIARINKWLSGDGSKIIGTDNSLYFMDGSELVTRIEKTGIQEGHTQCWWMEDIDADSIWDGNSNFQFYQYPWYNKTNRNMDIYVGDTHYPEQHRNEVKWLSASIKHNDISQYPNRVEELKEELVPVIQKRFNLSDKLQALDILNSVKILFEFYNSRHTPVAFYDKNNNEIVINVDPSVSWNMIIYAALHEIEHYIQDVFPDISELYNSNSSGKWSESPQEIDATVFGVIDKLISDGYSREDIIEKPNILSGFNKNEREYLMDVYENIDPQSIVSSMCLNITKENEICCDDGFIDTSDTQVDFKTNQIVPNKEFYPTFDSSNYSLEKDSPWFLYKKKELQPIITLFFDSIKNGTIKYASQMDRGISEEKEHKETLTKIIKKLKPDITEKELNSILMDAYKGITKDHLKEDSNYYASFGLDVTKFAYLTIEDDKDMEEDESEENKKTLKTIQPAIQTTDDPYFWLEKGNPSSYGIILENCQDSYNTITIESTIRKQKGKWHVYSEKGKHLGGPYNTREEAVHRLQQCEYFKRK